MNLQQYVFNNPVNWIDPSGLDVVIFKDEGIHKGVAIDTTRGVYRIDLLPNTRFYLPLAITDVEITPWKGYPGEVLGEPIKFTPEQGDQFLKWAEDHLKDYKGIYIVGGADCRDLSCELYRQASILAYDQEPQTCPAK